MRRGKHFEKKTHQIVSSLNPNKDAIPNVEIRGKLSESSREVDLVLRDPSEFDFIAYECKDESRAIGTPTIEAYNTKLMDIGAKKGAIVSNSPFSRPARRMAKRLGVELLHLVDSSDEAIKTRLFAPSGVVHQRVKSWTVFFAEKPPIEVKVGDNPNLANIVVQAPGLDKMPLKGLANYEWNKIADDPATQDGRKIVTIHGASALIDGKEVHLPPLNLQFDIEYGYRVGKMDITASSGIYNVEDSSYQTSSMAIGPFSEDIINGWQPTDAQTFKTFQLSTILHTRSDLLASH